MTNQNVNKSSNSKARSPAGSAVIAFGVWLPIGYIGASLFAIGLIQLFGGEMKPLSALVLAVGGVLLAVFSWRHAQSALDVADGATASTKTHAQAPAFYRAALGTYVTVPD